MSVIQVMRIMTIGRIITKYMTKIINKKIKGGNRHWKNFIDKDYLGSHNLEEGEEMLLTISKFEGEETVKTADGDKTKMVLYFNENVQKMILNITNATILSSLYGSHPENWVGKKIQVYAAAVKAFGKVQDALRIRDFVPKEAISIDDYKSKMNAAVSLVELAGVWKSFPAAVRANLELENHKNELKAKLTTLKNENN